MAKVFDERAHRQMSHEWLPVATTQRAGYMSAEDKRELAALRAEVQDLIDLVGRLQKQLAEAIATRDELLQQFARMRVAPYYAQQMGGAIGGPITSSGLTMNSGRMLGRRSAGTGAIEELDMMIGDYYSEAPTATGYVELRLGATTYRLLAST